MNYAIGILLALAVAAFARGAGFDRDRSFYPTVLVVVASYYVLFAVMGGSTRSLMIESLIMAAFVICSVTGFKRDLWLVVFGLAIHGVMDSFHAKVVDNPGVPEWWPGFCLGFDVMAAVCLAWLLKAAPPRRHGG